MKSNRQQRFMDLVPQTTLQAVASRLNESVPDDRSQWATSAPNAILVCNAFSLLLQGQRRRQPKSRPFQHTIRWPPDQPLIRIEVSRLRAVNSTEIDALRKLSSRVRAVSFLFETDDGSTLLDGKLLIEVVDYNAHARDVPPPSLYTAPKHHNVRQLAADWTNSCVLAADRSLVLRLIDTVHNMHDTMPVDIAVSIEPIVAHSFVADDSATNSKKRKLSTADINQRDDSSSNSSTVTDRQLVGYAVGFAGVPNFNANFFDHLALMYAGRFLDASVVFAHRRSADVIFEQQLIVCVSADHTLVQQAKPYAQCGAKRLCRKLWTDQSTRDK